MFERDWIACPEYDSRARLNNQHIGGGGLYEHFKSTRISTSLMYTIGIVTPSRRSENGFLENGE